MKKTEILKVKTPIIAIIFAFGASFTTSSYASRQKISAMVPDMPLFQDSHPAQSLSHVVTLHKLLFAQSLFKDKCIRHLENYTLQILFAQ